MILAQQLRVRMTWSLGIIVKFYSLFIICFIYITIVIVIIVIVVINQDEWWEIGSFYRC